MIKIQFLDTSIKVIIGVMSFNQTPYFDTVVTNDGTNITISNPVDPNQDDIIFAYVDVVSPVTSNIEELNELINSIIVYKNGKSIILESGDTLVEIGYNQLQNINGVLYWNGAEVAVAGGNVVTASNGINFSGGNPNDLFLGGPLTQGTIIDTNEHYLILGGTDPDYGFNQQLYVNANSNAAQLYSSTSDSLIGWDAGLNRLTLRSGSLAGITMTNDGTNNLYFDPAGFTVSHNSYFQFLMNDGAGKIAVLSMDNVESVLGWQDMATGSNSQVSFDGGSWNASYQNATLSRIRMNDAVGVSIESGNFLQILDQNTQTTPNLTFLMLEDNTTGLCSYKGLYHNSVFIDTSVTGQSASIDSGQNAIHGFTYVFKINGPNDLTIIDMGGNNIEFGGTEYTVFGATTTCVHVTWNQPQNQWFITAKF